MCLVGIYGRDLLQMRLCEPLETMALAPLKISPSGAGATSTRVHVKTTLSCICTRAHGTMIHGLMIHRLYHDSAGQWFCVPKTIFHPRTSWPKSENSRPGLCLAGAPNEWVWHDIFDETGARARDLGMWKPMTIFLQSWRHESVSTEFCSASFLFFYRIKLAGKVKARRFRSPFTPPAIKERFHGGKRREQGPSERRTDLFREQVIDCTVRWTFEEQVLKGDAPAELLNIVVVGVSNSFWYIDEDMIYCTVHPARWCGRNIGQKSRRPLFSSHWNVQIWTDWQRQSVVRCNGTRVQGNEK